MRVVAVNGLPRAFAALLVTLLLAACDPVSGVWRGIPLHEQIPHEEFRAALEANSDVASVQEKAIAHEDEIRLFPVSWDPPYWQYWVESKDTAVAVELHDSSVSLYRKQMSFHMSREDGEAAFTLIESLTQTIVDTFGGSVNVKGIQDKRLRVR